MQPAFMGRPVTFAEVDAVLTAVLSQGQHAFLPSDPHLTKHCIVCALVASMDTANHLRVAAMYRSANQCKLVTLIRDGHLLAATERGMHIAVGNVRLFNASPAKSPASSHIPPTTLIQNPEHIVFLT